MKTLLAFALLLLLITIPMSAFSDVYVHGYCRQDGTCEQPYYRSSPDHSYNNNWEVRPNVNPYTGKEGDRSPTLDNQSPRSNRLHSFMIH